MSKQTVIVSGGMVEKDFALSILKSEETEFVIGVDRGLVFLYDNEIKPDYIVGDFDSVPRKLVEYYREELDVPVREFNPVKDASDTEIALRLCLGLNRKKIVILGATGNRSDHLWANVQCLQIALEAGADACIMDAHNKIRLLDKTVTLKKEVAAFKRHLHGTRHRKQVDGRLWRSRPRRAVLRQAHRLLPRRERPRRRAESAP